MSLVAVCLAQLAGCGNGGKDRPDGGDPDGGLPMALPFEYTRPDPGPAIPAEEIASFTARITGLWKQVDYFTWVYETTHGMDASTGTPDYLIWWHDVEAVKAGDTVTFRNNSQFGGSHNNAEPTSMVLTQAIGGYLLTGDPAMGRIVEQFANSFVAVTRGFVYDEADPLPYLMARNIVGRNHEFTLPSGKQKAVDYSDWYFAYEGWNADRFHYPQNPTWGDIWVTSMRSKDDVPYLYRAAAWFPYLIALAPDESVREAAREALEHMQGFADDIVTSGWKIRTKDAQGQPYTPGYSGDPIRDEQAGDLGSFVWWTDLIADAECDARLSTALMATGETLDVDCGDGQGSSYDQMACGIHYYNYGIIDHYHLAALHLALTMDHPQVAERLLRGLVTRLERYQDPESGEPGWDDDRFERDVALLLLKGATLGLPLTTAEGRKIQAFYSATVDAYEGFPYWDLWDAAVPDGTYSFRDSIYPAHRPEAIRAEELAFLLEYCWSPFKNPASAPFVDCQVVADPTRWGRNGD